jgi:hypothetical protein
MSLTNILYLLWCREKSPNVISTNLEDKIGLTCPGHLKCGPLTAIYPGSTTGQSMWHLWLTKCCWDRCFSEYFGLLLYQLINTFMLYLSEGKPDDDWKPSSRPALFRKSQALKEKYFKFLSLFNCVHNNNNRAGFWNIFNKNLVLFYCTGWPRRRCTKIVNS